MARRGRYARCKLLAWPGHLQLLVLVEHEAIRDEICTDAEDAFALAERWKRDLRERGWQQIVPGPIQTTSAERPPL